MSFIFHTCVRIVHNPLQVCCGSPLIRTGQSSIVEELQKKNISVFSDRGIQIVMTMCAGCGSTLKHDYSPPFSVNDVTEVLTGIDIPEPARLDCIVGSALS